MAANPGKLGHVIDAWSVETFDEELLDVLRENAELIRGYHSREHEIVQEHDLDRFGTHGLSRPSNQFALEYFGLVEGLIPVAEDRTIRAFHFTRLLDFEIARFEREGIHLSSIEWLHQRLNDLQSRELLNADQVRRIFASSPLHGDQIEGRNLKFWMTSYPFPLIDGGVEPLISQWGGEVANMWLSDPDLVEVTKKMGSPQVLEVAAPLNLTNHAYCAAGAFVLTYARAEGLPVEDSAFDLYVTSPMGPERILQVSDQEQFSRRWVD